MAKAFLRLVLSAPILAKLGLDWLTVEPRDFLSILLKETRTDMTYKIPIVGSEESLRIYIVMKPSGFVLRKYGKKSV